MKLKVYDVFKINQSLDELLKQNFKLPFKDGYALMCLKKELDSIEQYAAERINKVIDSKRMIENCMTDEETLAYTTIMNSSIEIDNCKFDFESLKNNQEIILSLPDIEAISVFFEEK